METYLTLYYVYLQPESEAERDFRYLSWLLEGLLTRQGLKPKTEEAKRKLQRNKVTIENYIAKLYKNQYFLGLKDKAQEQVRKSLDQKQVTWHKHWRKDWNNSENVGWIRLAKQAGFNEDNSEIYSYLSNYAHSGYLSVMQIWQAQNHDDQKMLCKAPINIIGIVMAFFIDGYCTIFKDSREFIERNREWKEMVEDWIKVGKLNYPDLTKKKTE